MSSSYPLVIIQHICTIWTKAARGGYLATKRNQTAHARPLSTTTLINTKDNVLIHAVIYGEQNGFQQPIGESNEQKEQMSLFYYDYLHCSYSENILHLTVEWERSEGMPRRSAFPRPSFQVHEGQWIRFIYNLRLAHGWEGTWLYKKHVLNIGLFPMVSTNVFLETEPEKQYIALAQV